MIICCLCCTTLHHRSIKNAAYTFAVTFVWNVVFLKSRDVLSVILFHRWAYFCVFCKCCSDDVSEMSSLRRYFRCPYFVCRTRSLGGFPWAGKFGRHECGWFFDHDRGCAVVNSHVGLVLCPWKDCVPRQAQVCPAIILVGFRGRANRLKFGWLGRPVFYVSVSGLALQAGPR